MQVNKVWVENHTHTHVMMLKLQLHTNNLMRVGTNHACQTLSRETIRKYQPPSIPNQESLQKQSQSLNQSYTTSQYTHQQTLIVTYTWIPQSHKCTQENESLLLCSPHQALQEALGFPNAIIPQSSSISRTTRTSSPFTSLGCIPNPDPCLLLESP